MTKQKLIFDCEIIGSQHPVFLVCIKNLTTKEKISLWHHKKGHMQRLEEMMLNADYTWISFNGINFDAPLMCAAIQGADTEWLKALASQIIRANLKSWEIYRSYGIEYVELDHIDMMETAPGVMVSLKTYIGRMGLTNMIDLPFDHEQDLNQKELKILEEYCLNDIEGTEALYKELQDEIKLREDMGGEYGIDIRSKSDAQVAEALLKEALGIRGRNEAQIPPYVSYKAPDFIKTKNKDLQALINALEDYRFKVDYKTGSPVMPDWLAENTFAIGSGTYQVGIGGLHSTHDKRFYVEETQYSGISDFDVASYYPSVILKCGLVPKMQNVKGDKFLEAYDAIYNRRLEAKNAGNKKIANSLKITLNGTFGKLGNRYSAFYSPDLLLAVTITGQLNLLCLIDELERIKGVAVYSANTDGITVGYGNHVKDKVMKIFERNSKRTGFVYEETPYKKIAMKDVNNYIAITSTGKAKRKGLYASNQKKENPLYLMKNPTMEVCANMATDFLRDGFFDVKKYKNIRDFVAIRSVKGGGIQHEKFEIRDDWIETSDRFWESPSTGKTERRKSRPAPLEVGIGGTPFGRVARWYMTTESLPPITYLSSGNKVPKTEGAKLCMTLPSRLPKDLDYSWYIMETRSMLQDMGVPLE